ncbi:mucin-1 [Microsporum canis CBS 113480]|uniref:Mucin-1 n=1 Tax=Arthroderma otae (strain ATCC MYA-4605 / CBS 113480) TaxID=554155 RepID=C5FE83_ARTOC|nr:mucin-1 [Microsporum canis CBS 113480]EEQ28117.1 mucin-1 [Microsporum canis CBS 113480]
MERPRLLDPEEERRRRERRHRERDARHKSRPRRGNNYKLDVIDKLDVTGIYGPGTFHHDGPFDACNPHRNRKGSRAAPMQAFPKDSRNMALGGAGPNNSKLDLNQIHGRGQEGYSDFSTGGSSGSAIPSSAMKADAAVAFNPTSQIEQVHSDVSMGLGSSTFLEGTPASRAAIQRKASESETMHAGLQRKKSLAQKIRGINNRSIGGGGGRVISPEPLLHRRPSEAADNPPRHPPPPPPPRATSSRRANTNDRNPFFNSYQDYDDAYDVKSARIQGQKLVDTADDGCSARPSSPRGRPERKESSDGMPSPTAEESKPASGFINRVKSLRKPRARPTSYCFRLLPAATSYCFRLPSDHKLLLQTPFRPQTMDMLVFTPKVLQPPLVRPRIPKLPILRDNPAPRQHLDQHHQAVQQRIREDARNQAVRNRIRKRHHGQTHKRSDQAVWSIPAW